MVSETAAAVFNISIQSLKCCVQFLPHEVNNTNNLDRKSIRVIEPYLTYPT